MEIIQQIAHPGNIGGHRTAKDIQYIVVHYTGNDGAPARNNALFYQRNDIDTSAHYFVDDNTVYQSVPDLRIAWAVGGHKYPAADREGGATLYGKARNANSLSVEMCDTSRDGAYSATEATQRRTRDLIRQLMRKYHVPIERVIRHFDVTGKHCPAYFVDSGAWAEFKRKLVKEGMEKDNRPAPGHKEGVDWAVKNGILKGSGGNLMLSSPLTREQMCTMLYRYDQKRGG